MLHSCRIKFGSITHLTDARYAAAAYADWVGFCFIPGHPRYIEPVKAKEIIEWLSGPVMVAEVGNMLPEEFREALEVLLVDTVQVNDESVALAWKEAGFQVIWEGNTPPDENMQCLCRAGESLHPEREIVDLSGLSLDEVRKNWLNPPPFAIQVSGDDESAPGMRDFSSVDELLELFEL